MTDTAILRAPPVAGLVASAAAGDVDALAALIEEHHAAMVRTAYVVTGDVQLAREAAHDAWVTAWQSLRSLREPERVRSWLVAIAANEARMRLRSERRRRLREIAAPPGSPGPDPSSAIDSVDLGRALERLEPDERALLAMRYVAGLDATEISRELGLSPSGVRSRLARLIDRLREDLDHD